MSITLNQNAEVKTETGLRETLSAATRKGHGEIVEMLRAAGAVA